MEAAIKAPSIRVSGLLISVIRTVTIRPVDAVDRALRARSTGEGVSNPHPVPQSHNSRSAGSRFDANPTPPVQVSQNHPKPTAIRQATSASSLIIRALEDIAKVGSLTGTFDSLSQVGYI